MQSGSSLYEARRSGDKSRSGWKTSPANSCTLHVGSGSLQAVAIVLTDADYSNLRRRIRLQLEPVTGTPLAYRKVRLCRSAAELISGRVMP